MFYLYNPQLDDFTSTPVKYKLFNKKPTLKYKHLNRAGFNKVIYDYSFSGLIPAKIFKQLPLVLRILFVEIEMFLWKRFNSQYEVYRNNSIKDKYSLICFSYKTALNWPKRNSIKAFDKANLIVMHLSHYCGHIKEKSINLKKYKNKIYLAGDSNIKNNKFFRKFFNWYEKDILVISFYVNDRFFSAQSKKKKSKKILVTGTLDLVDNINITSSRELYKFYNAKAWNSFRLSVANSKNLSFIKKYLNVRNLQGENFFKVIKTFKSKEYFKIDLPQLMASYEFYSSGTELGGFPVISNFEAAAAGCITIFDKSILISIPELDKFFPIFDGSLEDLKRVRNLLKDDSRKSNFYREKGKKYVLDNYSLDSNVDLIKSQLNKLYY